MAQSLAQKWRRLLAALATVLAFVSTTACRATERAAPGHEGSASSGYVLATDAQGRLDETTTRATGMRGHWYAYSDTLDCLKRHPAGSCSLLITPDPTLPNVAPTELGMCMLGVTARVIAGPDGTPDWGGIWGARVGLSLNDDGAYDAPAHGVSGFAFRLDSEPPPNMVVQVLLPTSTARDQQAMWGGATADGSPVHVGLNVFRWSDVGGPPYIVKPPPFDPTKLVAIEFGVHASPGAASHFSLCIRELTALTN